MGDENRTTLPYAGLDTPRLKPTHHSALAGWAWAALVLETLFKASVVAYAHHRSPTWPWARFHRNVGDPDLFIAIDHALLSAGALLAILALLPAGRKRWAAWTALAAHLFLLGIQQHWFLRMMP